MNILPTEQAYTVRYKPKWFALWWGCYEVVYQNEYVLQTYSSEQNAKATVDLLNMGYRLGWIDAVTQSRLETK